MLKAANTPPHPDSSIQAWIVCLTAALFFFYEFVQMNMFNAVNSELMTSFNVNAAQLGTLSSAYFIANILFMFPAGLLLDRFSTRHLIIAAMIICIIGTLSFSYVSSLETAAVCRFLTGIGGSFPFLCCLRLASRWFKPRQMALATGAIVTIAMLGGMAAQTPLTLLVQHTTWQEALRYDALLGVLFLVFILWQVRDFPDNAPTQESRIQKFDLNTLLQTTKTVLTNPSNWLFSAYVCLVNLPLMLLGGLWGSLYLAQVRHFTPVESSFITSMLFLGMIIGSPIVGWISDHLANRRGPMLIGALVCLGFSLLLMAIPTLGVTSAMVLFFALGFASSSQIIGYPAITESNSLSTAGSALGFASVIIMSGPAAFEPIFGYVLDQHWTGAMINNTRVFSPHAYVDALSIFPFACMIAYLAIVLTPRRATAHEFRNLADKN
jgi:sugar phosphate permease